MGDSALNYPLASVSATDPTMDSDDLEPREPAPAAKDLEAMSIEALDAYIAELKAEIARAERAIAGKQSARSAADAVFKS